MDYLQEQTEIAQRIERIFANKFGNYATNLNSELFQIEDNNYFMFYSANALMCEHAIEGQRVKLVEIASQAKIDNLDKFVQTAEHYFNKLSSVYKDDQVKLQRAKLNAFLNKLEGEEK